MKTKRIEWSYPTSPNADKFKLKDGGWTVEVVKHSAKGPLPGEAVAGFAEYDRAKAYAELLPCQWDRLTR
jgi:hypothetical protein